MPVFPHLHLQWQQQHRSWELVLSCTKNCGPGSGGGTEHPAQPASR